MSLLTTFAYQALTPSGEKIDGVVEAFDETEAVQQVRQDYPIVLSIHPVKVRKKRDRTLFTPSVSQKSLAMACSQLGIILDSGLPIVRALSLIGDQTEDKLLRHIFQQVTEDVSSGYSLADSFESRGAGKLPSVFIETIRAGEESGTLDVSFRRLHKYFDKSAKIKAKTVAALTYPIFVIAVAVVVIIIIMAVAVPMFTSTFASMGTELPLPTRMVIGMSNFVTHYGLIALVAGTLLVILLLTWKRKQEKGRLLFASLALRLPVLGKLVRMRAASQFANTMSTLLTAGLPIMQAIAITARVQRNYRIATQISTAAFALEEGKRLDDVLRHCPDLPTLLTEMTAVGEDAGSLEQTLDVVGEFFDSEVETLTNKALSLLEPILIVCLAFFVVLVLFAVYLAMFSMYGGYA